MSTECNHNCEGCKENCSERDVTAKLNGNSKVGKVIAVVSGKGGVGKSLITSLLAVGKSRAGASVAVLDADITGPSIPKCFGVAGCMAAEQGGIMPAITSRGIKIMSANLLLERDTDPVIWRGPLIAGMVTQFWTDVIWGKTDIMFIDMPPGTGDVPLTVFQSLPVDGIIIVTSPQELVSMIVAKAVNMAQKMNIPVLGLIENMSYALCPHCNERIELFGKSRTAEVALNYGLPVLGTIPIDSELARACDNGRIEDVNSNYLDLALTAIDALPCRK